MAGSTVLTSAVLPAAAAPSTRRAAAATRPRPVARPMSGRAPAPRGVVPLKAWWSSSSTSNSNGNGGGAAAAEPPAAPATGDSVAAADTVSVPLTELRRTCRAAVASFGYDADETATLVEVLLYAQLRGNNQGIIKITTGGVNRAPDVGAIDVAKDTRLSALINGNKNNGIVVLCKAMRMAKEKAKASGFGIVGTNNTSTSTGALGYYAEQLAADGMIGVVLAQSPEFVAPHGAKQAVFGTNPICIGIPAAQGPVVMDMATAAYAWFGLLEAKTAGKPIPGDVALDANGVPTTDPNAVLEGGAIRVFDRSYKGSNLALMVELLAGPLVGAAVADKLEEKNWGNLVVAIDPTLLADKDAFAARAQVVLDRVRNAEKLPGVDQILLPGERGARKAAAVEEAGALDVERNLWAALQAQAASGDRPAPRSSAGAPAMATRLCHPHKNGVVDPYASMMPPIYQTATFDQPSAVENGPYDYTRSGNPTRDLLQNQMAALENAHSAYAFGTGMAALAASIRACVEAGDHIVAGEDIYGGTSRLLANVIPAGGVTVSNVDTTDPDAVRAAIVPGKTKLVMLESPTNPRMQVCPLKELIEVAHAGGAKVVVDNSIMAPVFQQPIAMGADICMTSATKFIAGHSDVTGGILSVKDEELAKKVYFLLNAEGSGMAPFECWLAYRGLKTMSLRMEKQAENCLKIAQYLETQPLVTRVNYPGLPSNVGYRIQQEQATSGGSLLSFTTGDASVSRVVCESAEFFKITVSFGSVSSLISMPCFMSHASIPAEVRAARGLPDDLVRISAGIEDVDDLIADLDQAFAKAAEVTGAKPATRAAPAAAASREAALEARIAELEAKLSQR